jgi:kynurenine formamidase
MCTYYDISPRRGDILFIRTGVIPEWDSWSVAQKKAYAAQKTPEHAGVEASLELLEWLWDGGIAAVAGDAISWEVGSRPRAAFVLTARRGLLGGTDS